MRRLAVLAQRHLPASSRQIAELVRFVAVGVLNTAVGYVLYAIGLFAGAPPEIALLLTFGFGILFNYQTYSRLAFNYSGRSVLLYFAVAYLFLYLVDLGSVRVLHSVGVGYFTAQAILLPPMAVLAFIVLRFAIFRVRRRESDGTM